jgi:hypothetical protein
MRRQAVGVAVYGAACGFLLAVILLLAAARSLGVLELRVRPLILVPIIDATKNPMPTPTPTPRVTPTPTVEEREEMRRGEMRKHGIKEARSRESAG